ncbi:NF-X1-type zinc finger protein NFXL1-like isoform X2 [Octopus sinensis]|uniref:NF-X1-type zinc finger protein NFXL1-like isoform X2 n=1 Tax=Octopus sinensis TaxID=2607531 RepID=A0A7E6FIE4_9MOLL|nr:NF-X1-type zinc finger protein NFXL1-like isoform X2 [Octopus sinensis]
MVKINDCCQNCGKSGSQLRNCKRCKVVFYCSDICEMEDRDEHSRVCSVEKVASANADFDEQNIKSKKDKQTGDAKKDNDGAGNNRNDYNNVPSFSSMEAYNDMGHLSNPYGFVAGATTRFNHPFQCPCCGGLKFNPVFCKRCRFTSYCSEQCLLRDFFTHCLECIPCDKRECARCSRSNVELTKCSGCNTVEYCSKLCENAAWEHHKLSCKTSKTKGDENSSKISIKGQCARCKKSDAVLKKCSGCNIVEYCSRACQSVDWTDHKTSCKRSVKSQCARCKKSGVALKRCVACNNVEYCSKVCQTADWEHHKNSCKTANTEDGESSSKIPVKGQCGKCKRSNVKLIKCPACDNREYCSQVCQIADWTDHRKSCQISESKGECANCSRSMRKCSGCNSVEYCSKECESAHWKHHKTSCKPSKAEADDSSPSEKSVKSKCASVKSQM